MMNLRNLDLNLLVVFEAVYSSGNISIAAKTMNVSQPTVSNSLSRLREVMGDQLFIGGNRGVTPTPKAMQIIGPVREALQTIQDGVTTESEFDPASMKRNFKVILFDPLEALLMPGVIRQIQAYKTITLETLPLSTTPVTESLMDNSVDLVMSTFAHGPGELESETVGSIDLVAIARKGHPEIDGELTLDQFRTLNHVALIPKLRGMSRLDEELRHIGVYRHITYTVSKFWSFPCIVADTDLIAIIPADFAAMAARSFAIDVFPLPFNMETQRLYMTWTKEREMDPGHTWLRKCIRETYLERIKISGSV